MFGNLWVIIIESPLNAQVPSYMMNIILNPLIMISHRPQVRVKDIVHISFNAQYPLSIPTRTQRRNVRRSRKPTDCQRNETQRSASIPWTSTRTIALSRYRVRSHQINWLLVTTTIEPIGCITAPVFKMFWMPCSVVHLIRNRLFEWSFFLFLLLLHPCPFSFIVDQNTDTRHSESESRINKKKEKGVLYPEQRVLSEVNRCKPRLLRASPRCVQSDSWWRSLENDLLW